MPTGQTGIAIAGWGIAVDAVVADFIAGAAERLVVEGSERGGELLWVEGQGAILHPVYSGVTLGLYHGSVPHLLVLCHEAGQTAIEGAGGGPHPIPPLAELVELHERLALPVRPAKVVAVALNTRRLSEDDARAAIAAAEAETGLPADDPVRFGAARLSTRSEAEQKKQRTVSPRRDHPQRSQEGRGRSLKRHPLRPIVAPQRLSFYEGALMKFAAVLALACALFVPAARWDRSHRAAAPSYRAAHQLGRCGRCLEVRR